MDRERRGENNIEKQEGKDMEVYFFIFLRDAIFKNDSL